MTFHDLKSHSCGCDDTALPAGLISLDAALAICAAQPGCDAGAERLPVARAAGRVLAEAVASQCNVPPFANSAVDGYALCSREFAGPAPLVLPVADRTAAGDAATRLEGGTTVRIFTGAPLPAGADTVVAQEHVRRRGGVAFFERRPVPGENIRRAAEDMALGDTVLPKGRRIGPRDIAVAAAAGVAEVSVRRRLRVALLITGSELGAPGGELSPGQINDVNGPMLAAQLEESGLFVVSRTHVSDDLYKLCHAFGQLSEAADLVVTTGGVSVGEEDHLRQAFIRVGGQLDFAGVAVKPGKPIAFGRIGRARWLGLPGNPTAAFVGWHVFGRTLVAAMQEATALPRKMIVSPLERITHKPGRCELRPAQLSGFDLRGRAMVTTGKATYSGRVLPLAEAHGLLLIPAETEFADAETLLEFLPFDENGAI